MGLTVHDERTALESRAGVESLDELHAKRYGIIERLAPLKALHGAFGSADDRRKRVLECCKLRARQRLSEGGGKVTEGMIEAEGYADPEYESLLDEGIAAKIEYILLDNELATVNDRIRSREFELTAYSAETRLR
jgi:hypothetical protein